MQTEAPGMADPEVFPVPDNELCKFSLKQVQNRHFASTSHGDQVEVNNNNMPKFVCNIDPSLLIDPSCLIIISTIAGGPNATVLEGLYKYKPVAIKVIQPARTVGSNLELKEKFQREVTLLSKVKHENVVKFIGVSFEPSMLILTELMRGGTVQKYLWSMRPSTLDLKLSISFALDICRAMEHLHANGIIHRDLKPANLLLTEDMKHIKLADFGHAREISGAMTSEAGTYRWMAPELFSVEPLPRGAKKQYDHKADVYSFSIILWELLMNETPFKGRNNVMVAYATAKEIRPSLDNIPQALVPLLESCWAHDPKTRPEFSEITECLSNFFRQLCSTEDNEPSEVIDTEIEHHKSNKKEEESPGTHHVIDSPEDARHVIDRPEDTGCVIDRPEDTRRVIDRPEGKNVVKRRKKSRSSSFFSCCDCACLSD